MFRGISRLIKYASVPGIHSAENLVPEIKSDGASGYDLKAARVLDNITREVTGKFPKTIKPLEIVLFGAGFIMAVPEGIDCEVRPRSGLATKYGIILANGIGTVDSDYRGEVGVSLLNISKKPYTVNFGDRIAQLVFAPIFLPEFQYVDSPSKLPLTVRNSGGFGSTGISAQDGYSLEKSKRKIMEVDEYLMRIVLAAAERSNCVRGCPVDENGRALRDENGKLIGQTRKLGCVIARGDKIIASGYNTQYPGAENCAEVGCLREKRKIPSGERLEECRAIHAEEMAIIAAARDTVSVEGATMYCNAEPCWGCARKIAGLGIETLVVLEGGYSSNTGLIIVHQAGIKTRSIKL